MSAEQERMILAQCEQSKRPIPMEILFAPKLHLGLEMYWTGFNALSSCRSSGMGLSDIPWSSVKDYCEFISLYDDEIEDFAYLIREMDRVYLKYFKDKQDQDQKTKPPIGRQTDFARSH